MAGAKASNRGSPKRRPRTIEAALSYLEKASPAALATHRVRLVALAGRATAAPGAPRASSGGPPGSSDSDASPPRRGGGSDSDLSPPREGQGMGKGMKDGRKEGWKEERKE